MGHAGVPFTVLMPLVIPPSAANGLHVISVFTDPRLGLLICSACGVKGARWDWSDPIYLTGTVPSCNHFDYGYWRGASCLPRLGCVLINHAVHHFIVVTDVKLFMSVQVHAGYLFTASLISHVLIMHSVTAVQYAGSPAL